MKPFYILKLGGSIVTEKDSTEQTLRTELLYNIFTRLAELRSAHEYNLVLITGAGGNIHHLAHTYSLRDGTGTNLEKVQGALHTRRAVSELASSLAAVAASCNLPVTPLQTSALITAKNRRIVGCNTDALEAALIGNTIPLLGGDMVYDAALGMSICSGDAIAAELASLFPVTHLFFATDVDGVFDVDPKTNTDARLIENVSLSEEGTPYTLTGSTQTHDTTGGLHGKVESFRKLFSQTQELESIHIFNGLNPNNVTQVFTNSPFPHTTFLQ